jgi:hypothetical protein
MSIHSWLRWGNLEGVGLFTGDFERQVTIWTASPLGSRRDVYENGLETGVRGTRRNESFAGDSEGKDIYYFYQETLFTRDSETYVTMLHPMNAKAERQLEVLVLW